MVEWSRGLRPPSLVVVVQCSLCSDLERHSLERPLRQGALPFFLFRFLFESQFHLSSSQQHPILRGVSSASPAPAQTATSGQRPSHPQAPQPSASTSTYTRPRPKIPSHRFTTLPTHTDMSYSPQTHTLSCSLELPGVHPSHLRVSLGTCYFNHVKYVGIVGESVPVFGNESVLVGGLRGERSLEEETEEEARRGLRAELVGGIKSRLRRGDNDGGEREGGDDTHIKIGRIVNPNLRERKFGIFRRFIQVPSHTTVSLHVVCFCGFMIDIIPALTFSSSSSAPRLPSTTFADLGRKFPHIHYCNIMITFFTSFFCAPQLTPHIKNFKNRRASTFKNRQSRDITANLKHGVLALHIYCGPPFEQDDEEEVPVAFD